MITLTIEAATNRLSPLVHERGRQLRKDCPKLIKLSVPSRIFRAGKPGWNRGRQNSRPEDIFFDECVTSGGEFFDKS